MDIDVVRRRQIPAGAEAAWRDIVDRILLNFLSQGKCTEIVRDDRRRNLSFKWGTGPGSYVHRLAVSEDGTVNYHITVQNLGFVIALTFKRNVERGAENLLTSIDENTAP